jgi:hypothetical protein
MGYDYLEFRVDGAVREPRLSGESGWVFRSEDIPAGLHTVRWRYSKDASQNRGADRGWLDEVTFP